MSSTSSTRQLFKLATNAYKKGNPVQAAQLCRQVLQGNPTHSKALNMLGDICRIQGELDNAIRYYSASINADAADPEAYIGLARALASQDKANEAVKIAHKATQIAPQNAETHGMLVHLFMRFNHAHMALPYLEQIMPNFGNNAELLQYYSMALKVNEQREKADAVYTDMIKKHNIPASFRVLYETYLPRLPMSNGEIEEVRAQFEASLDRFIKEKPKLNLSQLSYQPLFNLAFHNRDNKDLSRKYCQLLRLGAPELTFTAPHCKDTPDAAKRPIRIGFVSRHMHDHPVGRCYRNVLLSLHAHPDFKVTLFQIENIVDDKIRQLASAGVSIQVLPRSLPQAQQAIAAQQLDILIYPDLGMDVTSYYLALARLAPYQACLTGHPDTTGIDTMDYFISSAYYETPTSRENYNETLLKPPCLDTIFDRPQPPEKWYNREELGLPAGKNLYVCPMAIQKIHSDFDDILAGILKKDANAVLVLFNDFQLQSASQRLQERILAKCPKERVLFLGWQPMDKLLSIMKTCDAVLATMYFGAGTTGQYATAFGVPMVNMPGRYARSRIVSGSYELMGIEDAPTAETAEDYVTTAVKLANDKAYKEKISQQLLAKNGALFEDNIYREEVVTFMKAIMEQKLERYL